MPNDRVQVSTGRYVSASPKVSVIIPAFNVSAYIADALDSVFAQTFENFEVVVVNDGSPDTATLENVLKPYRNRIVYAKQENAGVSAARNTALRLSRAPLIAQLDPDDCWLPNYLAVQTELMDQDPTLDVLYPNTRIFGDSVDAGRHSMDLSPSDGEVTFESLLSQKCNVLACVTARRESLIQAGMFDETLRSSEDFDMWLRIVHRGGRIAYHRQVLALYRRRQNSLSANPIDIHSSVLQVLIKIEQSLDLSEKELNTLLETRRRFEAMLSMCEGKKAFFQGDASRAIDRLKDANTYYRTAKLSLLVRVLSIAPGLLLNAYNVRDRFIFKGDTKY